jgi:hypothetical protein
MLQAMVESKAGAPFGGKKAPPFRKGGRRRSAHSAAAARLMALRKGGGAKPNPNAPLGQGGRFAALKQELAQKPGVTDPGGLAAFIGRKKYGAKKFAALGKK